VTTLNRRHGALPPWLPLLGLLVTVAVTGSCSQPFIFAPRVFSPEYVVRVESDTEWTGTVNGLGVSGSEVIIDGENLVITVPGNDGTEARNLGQTARLFIRPVIGQPIPVEAIKNPPKAPGAAANAQEPATFLPKVVGAAGYQTYHNGKAGNAFTQGIQAFDINLNNKGPRDLTELSNLLPRMLKGEC
jgi:hypothetical protein